MTYEINIPSEVYMNWPFVNESLTFNIPDIMFKPTTSTWFNNRHPEILKVSDLKRNLDNQFFRTFTFESEDLYTWFLLQQ